MEDTFLFCITLFTFSVIFLFCYIRYVFTFFERNKIRTVFVPNFPLGHITDVVFQNKTLYQLLREIYNKFKRKGCQFGGVYVFLKPAIIIVEPKLIEVITCSNSKCFQNNDELCFLTPKEKYDDEKTRNKLKLMDNNKLLDGMIESIFNLGNKMSFYLKKTPENNKEVDLSNILLQYFSDISARSVFGIETDCLGDLNHEFSETTQQFMKKTFDSNFKNLISICNYLNLKIYGSEIDFYKKIIEKVITHRKKNDENKKCDLIQALIESNLNSNEITNIALDFFVCNLSLVYTFFFSLYELSVNKEIQEELRGEVVRFTKETSKLNLKNLAKLSYLETVVKETFRKYPPVPFISKICTEEFSNENYNINIPKNCLIFFPIYGIHHNSKHYINPEMFDPDRFSEENQKFIDPHTYLPFGLGSYNAMKLQYASLQIKLGLTNVLQKFKLSLGKKCPMQMEFDEKVVKIKPKHGMWLKLEAL